MEGAAEFCYRRFVRGTKLTPRFPEVLELVRKLEGETMSEDSSTAKSVLGVTNLEKAVFLSADEHDVLLYTETAAAECDFSTPAPFTSMSPRFFES